MEEESDRWLLVPIEGMAHAFLESAVLRGLIHGRWNRGPDSVPRRSTFGPPEAPFLRPLTGHSRDLPVSWISVLFRRTGRWR